MDLKCYLRNQQNKSFTLIELLVVIAIIGLLSSVVLVSMSGVRDRARVAKGLDFGQSVQHALGAYAVGWWSFEAIQGGKVIDGSSYGNDGTVYGANVVSGLEQLGNALSFDGVDDYVNAGNAASLQITDKVTYEAWIKVNSLGSGDDAIMARYWSPNLWIYGGGTNNRITFSIDLGAGGAAFAYGPTPSLGKWYHVAGTYDKSLPSKNLKLYVNGRLEATADFTQSMDSGTRSVGIGKLLKQYTSNFNGLIDEARIYAQAISSAEIQKHYAEGLEKHRDLVIK